MPRNWLTIKELADHWGMELFEVFGLMKEGLPTYLYGKKIIDAEEFYGRLPASIRFGQYIPPEAESVGPRMSDSELREHLRNLYGDFQNYVILDLDISEDPHRAKQQIEVAEQFMFKREDVARFEQEHNLGSPRSEKQGALGESPAIERDQETVLEPNVFCLRGNTWEFVFEGRRLPSIEINNVRKLLGFRYYHHLISLYVQNGFRPAEPVGPLQLELAVDRYSPDTVGQFSNAMVKGQLVPGGLTISGPGQLKIEPNSPEWEERGRLRKAVEEKRAELSEAEDNNNLGLIEKRRMELEELEETLSKECGHLLFRGKKDLKDSDSSHQQEKARSRVRMNIKRALAKIDDSVLREHLRKSLKSEKSALFYNPLPKQIRWKIEDT